MPRIDCNAFLGAYPWRKVPGTSPDALLKALGRTRIDTAWVTRWGARHFMDRQPFFVSHAIPDALCRATQSPYPILLYSPSFTGIRTEVADLGPYLASCGYVVVAMDHFDAYGTVFPDGSYLRTNIASSSAEGTRDRIRDVFFVLDELARWNESDPDFASRLDLGRVATMGYSWGGEVAGESACTSSRIHAAIIVDWPLNSWAAPVLVASGLSKPCLLMGGTFLSAHQSLFNRLTRDAVSVQFSVADHNMYCDQYWLFANYNLPTGREIARTLHAYARWFLDRHFKGSTDPIPAAAGFPKLNAVTQK